MKKLFTQLRLAALTGLALAATIGVSKAQTFTQGEDYNQNFDVGANTVDFHGSGSVASWIYWYNTPGDGSGLTNAVALDQTGLASSGSLTIGIPWSGVAPGAYTQNLVFGTFGNQYGYDQSVAADMTSYTNVSFWVHADPTNSVPRNVGGTNLDYGTISVGFFYPYAYEQLGVFTIPLSASNGWVQFTAPISPLLSTLTGITGLGFNINGYDGLDRYLDGTNSVLYVDSILVHVGHPPPPPTLSAPVAAVNGLNCIATVPGANGQYNRYQLCTVASTGYSFVGQPSVTYSWTTKSFPLGTGGGGWQQHFFLLGNYAPGQYDTAGDWNLPDIFWVTVQQNDVLTTNGDGSVTVTPGTASMNFRYKTNEPNGNAMIFNTTPYSIVTNITYTTNMDMSITTNTVVTTNNPNQWPIQPVATLAEPAGAAGTWSVTVANSTNITITSPTGLSTNFNISADVASVFTDPLSIELGGQPNVTTAGGKYSIYSSFSVTGNTSPFSDNFLTDTAVDTNYWRVNEASDQNGIVLVPPTAALWVPWTVPDTGFALQLKDDLTTTGGWTAPTPVRIIRNNGHDEALLTQAMLPSATQDYFQLIKYQFTGLQVLLDGETSAPGTLTGKTGTPTAEAGATTGGAIVNVTINAVDALWHIIPGIGDAVALTTSADPNSTLPLNAALANGTLTEQVLIDVTGNYTVTASDVTNPAITSNTSSPVEIDP